MVGECSHSSAIASSSAIAQPEKTALGTVGELLTVEARFETNRSTEASSIPFFYKDRTEAN